MKLYVSRGNKVSGEWQELEAIALKLGPALYDPEQPRPLPSSQLGLTDEAVILPRGEALAVSVAYDKGNCGMSLNVTCGDDHLLQVGGVKLSELAYDPNVILRSPQDVHVSVMVGGRRGKRAPLIPLGKGEIGCVGNRSCSSNQIPTA